MAYNPKRKYRRRGNSKSKKAIIKKALAKSWKRSVAKVCKRVIARQAETKCAGTTAAFDMVTTHAANYSSTSISEFKVNNIVQLTPGTSIDSLVYIGKGTGQSDRVGNEIMTKRLNYKGIIYPYPVGTYNPTPVIPTEIKCVIFSLRPGIADQTKDSVLNILTTGGTTNSGEFFQDGNGSTGIVTNTSITNISDMIKTFNRDVITVHKVRTFKLGGQYAQTGTYASGGVNYGGGASNPGQNDFNYNVKFNMNLTKYCPKQIRFSDTSASPTSRKLFAVWILCDANGAKPSEYGSSAAGVYWRRPASMRATIDYEYTDM